MNDERRRALSEQAVISMVYGYSLSHRAWQEPRQDRRGLLYVGAEQASIIASRYASEAIALEGRA